MSPLPRLESAAVRYAPEALFALLPPPSSTRSAVRLQKAMKTPLAFSPVTLRTDGESAQATPPMRQAILYAKRKDQLRTANPRGLDKPLSLARQLADLSDSIPHLHSAQFSPALRKAHGILDTQHCPQPCSSTAAIRFRQDLYGLVLSRFAGSHLEGAAIRSLLTRQIEEDLPLSTAVIRQVFRHLLTAPSVVENGLDSAAIVRMVLPLLPPQVDIELFTMLMTTLAKTLAPEPKHLRSIISDGLRRLGIQKEQDWPLSLCIVMMHSYAQRLDIRGAVRQLGHFRLVLEKMQAARAGDRMPDDDSFSLWSPEEVEQIVAPFTTLLKLWSTEGLAVDRLARQPQRLGSRMPETIVRGLVQILETANMAPSPANAEEQCAALPVDVPIRLVNAWMNAERIAGHTDTVFEIWRWLCNGQGWAPEVSAVKSPRLAGVMELLSRMNGQNLSPDEGTFAALFKTFRYMPSVQSPPRQLLGQLQGVLEGSAATGAAALLTGTNALDTLLSSTLVTPQPDLPLVLVVLEMMQQKSSENLHVASSARTVDVLAAALIRLYRSGLPIFEKSDNAHPEGINYARKQARISASYGWQNLAMWEWEVVTCAVDRIRLAQGTPETSTDTKTVAASRQRRIELPMRKVLGKLVLEKETVPSNRQDRQETHRVFASSGDPSIERHVAIRVHEEEVRSVLDALRQLYERAILLQARMDPAWDGMPEEKIIQLVKAQAGREAFPCTGIDMPLS